MIKIENVVTPSPEQWRVVILGMRNAKNSWARSDSHFNCSDVYEYCDECPNYSEDDPLSIVDWMIQMSSL